MFSLAHSGRKRRRGKERKKERPDEPLRVASSNSWVSIACDGSWTYRTTDPRMKQFFTVAYDPQTISGTKGETKQPSVSSFAFSGAPLATRVCVPYEGDVRYRGL
jgi:hypothetical protein